MINMKSLCLLTAAVLLLTEKTGSSKAPVIMWTNQENVRYPMLISGKSLTGQEFSSGYVEQILQAGNQNLAVFIQDQLSLSDITNYADVFNEESDGNVFSSLKNIMEKYEATHIPSVVSPQDEIVKVQRKFNGKIYDVESLEDVEKLQLNSASPNMILVNLPKSDTLDRKASLRKNDEIIGKLTNKLSRDKRNFAAVYTGSKATEQSIEHLNVANRHLLATDTAAENVTEPYTFFNITSNNTACVFMYMSNFTFQVIKINDGPVNMDNHTTYQFNPLSSDTSAITTGSTCDEKTNTATLTFDFKDHLPEGLTKFTMKINISSVTGYWSISEWMIDFSGNNKTDTTQTFEGSNWVMANENTTLYGTLPYANPGAMGYSYHCGQQTVEQSTYNATATRVQLVFIDFQLQYKITNDTFGPPNDCVGFFTGAIWMTIIFFILMISILTFGLVLLANIQTMDRFDDPKGKTIQVNASD